MKIVEPSVELVDFVDSDEVMKKLELCGKVSRQSKLGDADNFVRNIIKRGHESVLEHVSLTFHIVCDRAIQNELVRHRHASFTVESTRYCAYDELTVIQPTCGVALNYIEDVYNALLKEGKPPDIARAILPLCLATELYMTANLREWRHILKLRTDKAAHPQMRFIMKQILDIFRDKLPVIVEDIKGD